MNLNFDEIIIIIGNILFSYSEEWTWFCLNTGFIFKKNSINMFKIDPLGTLQSRNWYLCDKSEHFIQDKGIINLSQGMD